MLNNKCIQCGKNKAEQIFSREVEIVNRSVAIKDLGQDPYSHSHWNLNRKFEISGLICNPCLEKAIKKQKSSDLSSGISLLMILILLLLAIVLTKSTIDTNSVWIMVIFMLSCGFGSYFFLSRYFKRSDKRRGQKEANRMIENGKLDIVENRNNKKLCEICGIKGDFEIRIYYRTQYPNPSLLDIPRVTFFRCRQHEPTDREFEDLRAKSFKISVTKL